MGKNLMIVESPAKAKTIEKFLGDGFSVTSCYGHIRDLPRDSIAVDTDKDYTPEYVIPEEKKKVVKELKRLAKDAEKIWLATDEDREGEAISWHLSEILNINPDEHVRIVFHEITKPAIEEAMQNPRGLNRDLFNAQQARRVLDRLVGFELSPILWRKISLAKSLSAGRVQSVAVRLIVEKERDILAFVPKSYFRVVAQFIVRDTEGKEAILKAVLSSNLPSIQDARSFLESCAQSTFSIEDIQVKPATKSPSAPFTTSTLQQEASRKLGFSVSRTMSVAQSLYEAGKITYMRTDSVNLSTTALSAAASQIRKLYEEEYVHTRQFKTKSVSAQEAHEAIRPTYFEDSQVSGSHDEERLYELIWKRTLASQMSEAQLERTTVSIGISELPDQKLTAKGEVIKFDGFLKLYLESTDDETEDDESGILPPMEIGQELSLKEIHATERFSRPPARYTEASLVKQLEELGIGRPSTYAPTISTVQKRGYVIKENKEGTLRQYQDLTLRNGQIYRNTLEELTGLEKNKLRPTDVGMLVNDFLIDHFEKIMDYNFTANIEKQFDEIANGNRVWNDMINEFYSPFHKQVEETIENAERVTGERLLGTDPVSGKPISARMGRYGSMIQIGTVEDEEKPKFAKLRPHQNLETITLEEALELFKLPRTLGDWKDNEVIASEGRYGPYIRYNGKFYSIKDQDPLTITLEEAIEVVKEGLEKDIKKQIKVFEDDDIQILNGPYGPYIKSANKNFRIPKTKDAASLTLEEAKAIIEKSKNKKGGSSRKKKS